MGAFPDVVVEHENAWDCLYVLYHGKIEERGSSSECVAVHYGSGVLRCMRFRLKSSQDLIGAFHLPPFAHP